MHAAFGAQAPMAFGPGLGNSWRLLYKGYIGIPQALTENLGEVSRSEDFSGCKVSVSSCLVISCPVLDIR